MGLLMRMHLFAFPNSVVYDANVRAMMDLVTDEDVTRYIGNLSGEQAVTIGQESYTIATRHTQSGVPIQKAAHYVYEHLDGLGYAASYHSWITGQTSVIGEKSGDSSPDSLVLMIASLDDLPAGSTAPGADDNASGCCALMVAAETMANTTFAYTVRFIFFTGTEQGLLGSDSYVAECHAMGENIVAVMNMFMIGYSTSESSGSVDVVIRNAEPADQIFADLFSAVVDTYTLNTELLVEKRSVSSATCDIGSFWNLGYPGFYVMQDYDDFNPYYHTVDDRLSNLNIPYCRRIVQAALGTLVHLAVPVWSTKNPDASNKHVTGIDSRRIGASQRVLWDNRGSNALPCVGMYTLHGRKVATTTPDGAWITAKTKDGGLPSGVYVIQHSDTR